MSLDPELAMQLATRTRFRRLWHVVETTSTQDLAATAGVAEDAIFWADHQTRGRGRQQRSWLDAPALDLLVTFQLLGLRLPNPLALPAVVPLCIAQALEPLVGRELRIKWPNDVHLDGRKLAGVLIDALGGRADDYLIGVGINVNRTQFPEQLGERATSVALATGRDADRHQLLLALAVALDQAVAAVAAERTEELAAQFARRLGLLQRPVAIVARGQQEHGRLAAIDFERLRLEDGRTFALGEVQAIGPG